MDRGSNLSLLPVLNDVPYCEKSNNKIPHSQVISKDFESIHQLFAFQTGILLFIKIIRAFSRTILPNHFQSSACMSIDSNIITNRFIVLAPAILTRKPNITTHVARSPVTFLQDEIIYLSSIISLFLPFLHFDSSFVSSFVFILYDMFYVIV